ncbi:hypothetical protein B0O99DRAFT_622596, partial [Bisporella sp. PMI_857]
MMSYRSSLNEFCLATHRSSGLVCQQYILRYCRLGSRLLWNGHCMGRLSAFRIPDEIASEDAGPLMCAGATVWSPLFDGGVRPW